MTTDTRSAVAARSGRLTKCPTGIGGLDEILDGGLPKGRPTLVCGGAGCGKTLLGMQFLVRGALDYGEPGAFIAFEERPEDLAANVASLGFELGDLEERKLFSLDYIRVDPSQIVENGEYDLDGLFLRLELAIDSIGAKRVVIDTLETLFGGLSNYGIVRAELRRLFEWLKEKGVTAIITAERGDGRLTRHGLEEYVSDCVVLLDHRVVEQVSTRRVRVVKYRGSTHGTNEYPFLIDQGGISVLPITSAGLEHKVSNERVSTGVPRLDGMLGGGYYRGSTVLVSGTAGAGKSSLAGHFADASCRAGERVLYFSFEESARQIVRNMRSIGLDLDAWSERGMLRFVTARPTAYGLETHLAIIHRHLREFRPSAVVLDPLSSFVKHSDTGEAHSMLVRLIDALKNESITGLFTSLTAGDDALEATNVDVSSIVDTWLLVRTIELQGERNRGLYVLKSRGMAHSNQIREFKLTDRGVELIDVYLGGHAVLTGSARAIQEARDDAEARARLLEVERKRRALERRRALHREQLAKLEAEFEADALDLIHAIEQGESEMAQITTDVSRMRQLRQADTVDTDEVNE